VRHNCPQNSQVEAILTSFQEKYIPFSEVTRKSLRHTLTEAGVSLDDEGIESLMSAYDTLGIFPDVSPVFKQLKDNPHIYPVVLSNGTSTMINASLTQSPDLSPYAKLIRQVVLVEPVKRFKPDPQVYSHLCEQVGKGEKGQKKDVWLVSGNPFDVVGANAVGLRTCWVDRGGKGWVDDLVDGEAGRPTIIVKGVDEVVPKVEEFLKD
jgi:2-haloacid dehalogenase